MAYLRVSKKGSFRAVCSKYNKVKKRQDQKAVSLDTDIKGIAQQRLREVERLESDVMSGDKIAWSWQDAEVTKSHIVLDTLSDGIAKYLSRSKSLRDATIEANRQSLVHLKDAIGDIPLIELDESAGQKFLDYLEAYSYADKGLKANTINIRLRSVNGLFKFLKKNGHIGIDINVDMVKVDKGEPLYFSEAQRDSILNHPKLTNRYRRVFKMYFETGFRLSMPFNATIEGNVFQVDAEHMKNHRTFKCLLSDESKDTILMMQELYAENPTKDAIKWYSKKFSKVLKELGIKNRWFHCMRHTFGVRRCIQTGNLWLVRDEMGHESVSVTERYTRIFRTDLEAHFPSLIKGTKDNDTKDKFNTLQAGSRA